MKRFDSLSSEEINCYISRRGIDQNMDPDSITKYAKISSAVPGQNVLGILMLVYLSKNPNA